MSKIISIIQIVSSVLLIISILLQQRGTGLSATFGGEGNIYRTKRGIEKILFVATIILAIIFLGSVVADLMIK